MRSITTNDELEDLTSNGQALDKAQRMQQDMRLALERIQQQTTETEELGAETLTELRDQRQQTERIDMDAQYLHSKLDASTKLQDSFDRWAMNWGGRHKRRAKAEASELMVRSKQREQIGRSSKDDSQMKVIKSRNQAARMSATTSTTVKSSKTASVKGPCQERKNDLAEQPPTLDEESKERLEEIARNDNELDDMLDVASASLDRLAELSLAINEESQMQNKNMDDLVKSTDKASKKQAVANSRIKRVLTGKWSRRSKQ